MFLGNLKRTLRPPFTDDRFTRMFHHRVLNREDIRLLQLAKMGEVKELMTAIDKMHNLVKTSRQLVSESEHLKSEQPMSQPWAMSPYPHLVSFAPILLSRIQNACATKRNTEQKIQAYSAPPSQITELERDVSHCLLSFQFGNLGRWRRVRLDLLRSEMFSSVSRFLFRCMPR